MRLSLSIVFRYDTRHDKLVTVTSVHGNVGLGILTPEGDVYPPGSAVPMSRDSIASIERDGGEGYWQSVRQVA